MPDAAALRVSEVLRRHHAKIGESDVAEAIDAGFREGWLRPEATPTASLSRDAREILERYGGLPAPRTEALRTNAARVTSRLAMELSSSLTTAEVADSLGIDATRVRHRVRDGALYALPSSAGGSSRFPAWQFDGGSVIPHLGAVLKSLPGGLHPVEVAGFFLTAHDVLEVDDNAVTPRDWLLSGGSPQPVVALASSLHAGM